MPPVPSGAEQKKQLIAEYARQGRVAEAVDMARRLCKQSPKDGHAWFLLGAIHGQAANLGEAEAALQKSVRLAPGMAVVHYNLGVIRQRLGRLEQAAQSMRQAVALNSQFAEAHQELGNILAQRGELEKAAQCYRQALAIRPQYPQACSNLAACLCRQGDYAAAEDWYGRALQIAPGLVEAAVGMSDIFATQGRNEEAVQVVRTAMRAAPRALSLRRQLGKLLLAAKDYTGAEACFVDVLAAAAGDVEAAIGYGNVLTELDRYPEAEKVYRRLLQSDPDNLPALVNLGRVYRELDRHEESMRCLRRAIELSPQLAEAHYNLANNYNDLYRLGEAEQSYRKALEILPAFAQAAVNLGSMVFSQGRIHEAIDWYRKAWRMQPDYHEAAGNYLMALNYSSDLSPEYVYEQHRDWGARQTAPVTGAVRARPDALRLPLRLGLVSGDFRNHSVAFFIDALLRHHDREQLHIVCYANVRKPDSRTDSLRALAAGWRDVTGMSDAAVATQVAEDAIDILVDLSGHTDGNRLGVLARKPAPVQVTYLGYPNTTGLSAVDYRISDAIADPPDQPELAVEKIVRLPGIFICYTPPDTAPPVQPEADDPDRPLTFGSFNSPAKISDELLEVWAELLAQMPESRLFLKGVAFVDESAGRRLRTAFEARGVDPQRLEVRGWTREIPEHLALYHRVDIALDTFPYNGTTTTCEALWMGVPVVTLSGRAHAGRVSHAILAGIGREQWAASNVGEYVQKAMMLAADVAALREGRAALRQLMAESLLTDAVQHARNMEQLMLSLREGSGAES
jgi:predicted O-linked N-acetylglucosamine transferase (SPINDLY family)